MCIRDRSTWGENLFLLEDLCSLTFVFLIPIQEDRNFESIYDLKGNGEEEMKQGDFEDNRSVYSAVSAQTAKTDATQVSAITYATEQLGITNQTSFLLLDLREPEDFELYHINESINYPAPNIARDRALPVFYQFKNKEDKLMIIYHNDEKNGIPSAQLFFEKGYDNIYLLSGGLEEFLQEFPELVEGKKVPVLPKKPAADKKKTILKRSNYTEDKKANGVAIANSHFKGATGNSSMMSGNDNISVSNQSVRSNNMSMRSASLKKD
eukprot:TRINITY_DN4081_c0_g1_i1.p1 TRINITY_DN4081_c0_g1~~TRINITY_DN4081_c0_g1_i1.p1  ORF type:complete len:266 (-),score=67.11 TRINITY_DN4081_c0_g1_i1:277-1074(-)